MHSFHKLSTISGNKWIAGGLVLFVLGSAFYVWAVLPIERKPPEYGTYINMGPDLLPKQVTWARIEISLPRKTLDFEMAFVFHKLQTYYLQLTVPYFVEFTRPGLGPTFFTQSESVRESVVCWHNSSSAGSLVTLEYRLKEEYFPPAEVHDARVGCSMQLRNLEVGKEPGIETFSVVLFSKQPRLPDDLTRLSRGGFSLTTSNFTLSISFSTAGEIGSRTFPSPTAIFSSTDFKSATWVINFQISENRGQTVQLSIEYPDVLRFRDIKIFVSGLLIALGLSVVLEILLESRRVGKKDREPLA